MTTTTSRHQEFVTAAKDWDNKYCNGLYQRSKFHVDAMKTKGRRYYDEANPLVIPESEWQSFEEHLNTHFAGFADQDDDDMGNVVGYAFDRLSDHIRPEIPTDPGERAFWDVISTNSLDEETLVTTIYGNKNEAENFLKAYNQVKCDSAATTTLVLA